jgi:hypothetical protein
MTVVTRVGKSTENTFDLCAVLCESRNSTHRGTDRPPLSVATVNARLSRLTRRKGTDRPPLPVATVNARLSRLTRRVTRCPQMTPQHRTVAHLPPTIDTHSLRCGAEFSRKPRGVYTAAPCNSHEKCCATHYAVLVVAHIPSFRLRQRRRVGSGLRGQQIAANRLCRWNGEACLLKHAGSLFHGVVVLLLRG